MTDSTWQILAMQCHNVTESKYFKYNCIQQSVCESGVTRMKLTDNNLVMSKSSRDSQSRTNSTILFWDHWDDEIILIDVDTVAVTWFLYSGRPGTWFVLISSEILKMVFQYSPLPTHPLHSSLWPGEIIFPGWLSSNNSPAVLGGNYDAPV